MEFKGSKTYENIINAYKGELAGVVLYSYLKEKMVAMGNESMAELLYKLAGEEGAHALAFSRLLGEDSKKYELSEEEITNLKESIADSIASLKAFVEGEKKAGLEIYPSFGEIAQSEGYENVAKVFKALAPVELHHGELLSKELELIK